MGGKQSASAQYPAGVKVRKWSSGSATLMIQFYYRNVCCRETLKLEATPSNVKYAARVRAEIINAITRNTFNYADFFPNSKNARRFGHVSTRIEIKKLLDGYLEKMEGKVETSTLIRYKRYCRSHLYPVFGNIAIQDLTSTTIREWLESLTCKRKTITNVMTCLRAIIIEALQDKYIQVNPLNQVDLPSLLKKHQKKSDFVIDPFDRDEINAILDRAEGQIKNLYQFAFFTGLRPSELMGLRWTDIDWIHSTFHVKETIVEKEKKDPKTETGFREVTLLPLAIEALQRQKPHTFLEGVHVFHNPRTNLAWETSQQLRRTAWMPLLKKVGVRYRNPYQTRHTYASMMLSFGENIAWISKQMGHADSVVTLKRYARFIKDNTPLGGYQLKNDWGGYLDSGQGGAVVAPISDKPTIVSLDNYRKKRASGGSKK